jgi:hypothetical protein
LKREEGVVGKLTAGDLTEYEKRTGEIYGGRKIREKRKR